MSGLRDSLKGMPFLVAVVRRLRRRRQIRLRQAAWEKYASANEVRKLNIGTSRRVLESWFNVDLHPLYPGQYFMDAANRFPFPDTSFDFIRSEHMIEHVTYLEAMSMLDECFRVMNSGGYIRIATPDLKKLARLYDEPLTDDQKKYRDAVFKLWRFDYNSREIGVVVNNIFDFQHRFIYDHGTLGEALSKAGFTDVVEVRPGDSVHAPFHGADAHASDDDYVTFETLTMEARKA